MFSLPLQLPHPELIDPHKRYVFKKSYSKRYLKTWVCSLVTRPVTLALAHP